MLTRIIKRSTELGFSGCTKTLTRKIRKKLFKLSFKLNLLHRTHAFNQKELNTDFLEKIITSEEFNKYLPSKFNNKDWISKQADNVASNQFDLLGSGLKYYEKIPWTKGFENKHIFYQSIKISCPSKMLLHQYNPDIKAPWELSRFQHIFILGKAYKAAQQTNDTANCIKYSTVFETQISDWLEQNPYLIGVNWVCPMDTAIRAINFIWGFYFFNKSPHISKNFWNKLINSLYQHAKYLEWNWETSDKPNNHYLSDLIGYLYLCVFFNLKNLNWCTHVLLEQFFTQIQPDGTCYEGSTSYHKLDTEIFLHFKLICQAIQTPLPTEFLHRFEKMIEFLQDCTNSICTNSPSSNPSGSNSSGNLVQIGDNDSGKIVTGISLGKQKNFIQRVQNYPQFGLVTIKKAGWHITLRYPTFKQTQPTGHFHQDWLSITLSINGIAILVDPGTYVYTANSNWRNLMRSWQAHNTFNVELDEQINQNLDLFQLPLTQQQAPVEINQTDKFIKIHTQNKKNENLQAHRCLKFNETENSLTLNDWWHFDTKKYSTIKSEWNLIFNPEIELKFEKPNYWIIEKKKIPICRISSTLELTLQRGFYSKNYGQIQSCAKLTAKKLLSDNEKQKIFIQALI